MRLGHTWRRRWILFNGLDSGAAHGVEFAQAELVAKGGFRILAGISHGGPLLWYDRLLSRKHGDVGARALGSAGVLGRCRILADDELIATVNDLKLLFRHCVLIV